MANIKLRDASIIMRWNSNVERALRYALGSSVINLKFDTYPVIVGAPRIDAIVDMEVQSDWQIAKVIAGKHGVEELLLVRERYEGGVEVSAEFIYMVLGDQFKSSFDGYALPKLAQVRYPEDSERERCAVWEWYWDEVFTKLREEAIMLQKTP